MFLYEEGRFYLNDDQGKNLAEITFTQAGKTYIIDHTWVDASLRGQGIAGKLVLEVVKKAVDEGLMIVPLCPFAKHEFETKPEYKKVWHNHNQDEGLL